MKKYYAVTVKVEFEEEVQAGKKAGQLRTINLKNKYLVHTHSVTAAEKLVKNVVTGCYDAFEIVEVKETTFLNVIEDNSDDLMSE